jgi:hypothetical protein
LLMIATWSSGGQKRLGAIDARLGQLQADDADAFGGLVGGNDDGHRLGAPSAPLL